MKRAFPIKICVICSKEFKTYKENHHGGSHRRTRRPIPSVTCSKLCSSKYATLLRTKSARLEMKLRKEEFK